MPRKGGGEGKYRSLKTGKYVSAYYAKRHPKTTAKVKVEKFCMGRRREEQILAVGIRAGERLGERRGLLRVLTAAASSVLGAEVREVGARALQSGAGAALKFAESAGGETWAKRWRERLEPTLAAVAEFDLSNPDDAEFLNRRVADSASKIAGTSGEVIASEVRKGVEGGLSPSEVSDRLLERLPDLTRSRADLIARTELHDTKVAADFHKVKKSGLRATKTWVHSSADNFRPEHKAQDGVAVALDEAFPDGSVVPSGPNCLCEVRYSFLG